MMMVAVNHRGGGRPDREILGRRRMLPRVFIFRMIFFSLSSFKPEEPRRWPTELENVCPRWGAIATSDDQNVGGVSTLLGRALVSQSAENFASPPSRLSPARVKPTRITHPFRRRVVACVAPRTLDDGNGARTARTAHPPSLRITTRDRTCGETVHRVPPGFDLSHEAKYLRTAVSNARNRCPRARTHLETPQRSPGQTLRPSPRCGCPR